MLHARIGATDVELSHVKVCKKLLREREKVNPRSRVLRWAREPRCSGKVELDSGAGRTRGAPERSDPLGSGP